MNVKAIDPLSIIIIVIIFIVIVFPRPIKMINQFLVKRAIRNEAIRRNEQSGNKFIKKVDELLEEQRGPEKDQENKDNEDKV